MAHANARLTPAGRLTLVGRIAAQPRRPIAHLAHEMGVSRATASRWWARYQQLGQAGLVDRPSIPAHSPRRTPAELEERILRLRRRERLGPTRIAARLHLPASTVHRVLVRHRMNRLGSLDRPTGRPIRRYEHPRPGDLVHLDVKKLGRIPSGGGHRVHGRADGVANRRADRSAGGDDDLHAAVDDHSRLADVEVLGDERAQTCARFWRRAHHWLAVQASPSTACSPTTGSATAAGCSGRRWLTPACAIGAPDPIGPRPTARWSGSTAPSWRSGPIGGCTRQTPPATVPCSPGSIGTIITAPTPPSAAGHRSAVSTTSLAITASRRGRPSGVDAVSQPGPMTASTTSDSSRARSITAVKAWPRGIAVTSWKMLLAPRRWRSASASR